VHALILLLDIPVFAQRVLRVLFAKQTLMNALQILVGMAERVWMQSIPFSVFAILVILVRCVKRISMNVPPILVAMQAFALML
jgi:hypothetical protein